jgi:putative membrane protein
MLPRDLTFWDYCLATNALRKAALVSVGVGLYCLLPLWKENSAFHGLADHASIVYSGPEVLLGLLLVLRSNAAYQRWWEGRTLWGKLVNISRNLVIKAETLVEISADDQSQLREHVQQFAVELKEHLRTDPTLPPAGDGHPPNQRMRQIYALLNSWRTQGLLSDDLMRVFDSEAREFLEVCGGCERIQKTPLAKSYRLFLYQGIALMLALLPWSLVNEIGVWAIPLTMVHAYILIGLQVLSGTVEDPFGTESDDLDLDGISLAIANTLE